VLFLIYHKGDQLKENKDMNWKTGAEGMILKWMLKELGMIMRAGLIRLGPGTTDSS
jgi:hypothetical protein